MRVEVGGLCKRMPSEVVCMWKFLSKRHYVRKCWCLEGVTGILRAWNWAFVSETKTIQWLLTFFVYEIILSLGGEAISIFLVYYHLAFASRGIGILGLLFLLLPLFSPFSYSSSSFFSILSHYAAQASVTCSTCLGLQTMGSQTCVTMQGISFGFK